MPRVTALPAQLLRGFADLARRARAASVRGGGPVLVWASTRVEPLGLPWALTSPGWVWAKPARGLAVWASGETWAAEVSGAGRFSEAARAWRRVAQGALWEGPLAPVAFAGFAFDAWRGTGLWEGFPEGVVAVPRVLRARIRGSEYLAVGCLVGPEGGGDEVERTLQALEGAEEASSEATWGQVLRQLPSPERWMAEVERAEAACRAGVLRKVVLARCVEVAVRATPDAVLRRLQDRYATCTVFAVARAGAVFLGASPERLAWVRRGRVVTQALAGTAPRGALPQEDQRLRAQLQESAKEAHEHELVAGHVRDALRPLCVALHQGRRGVVVLPDLQHLRTPFRGRLTDAVGILEVGGRLHPTPAVAGLPVQAATQWIRQHEPVPRGWYAGTVGWVDVCGAGELSVAIRSALLREGRGWAFSGCGVVAGSQPPREYQESQLKLRAVLEALGVQGP
jgi:isochorismate synthase